MNLYIGTTGENTTEYGGTILGVTVPFGMTEWCAMTGENQIGRSVYHYNDDKIIGFIGTHQPAIWMGDYGFISLMPETGSVKILSKDRECSSSIPMRL